MSLYFEPETWEDAEPRPLFASFGSMFLRIGHESLTRCLIAREALRRCRLVARTGQTGMRIPARGNTLDHVTLGVCITALDQYLDVALVNDLLWFSGERGLPCQ